MFIFASNNMTLKFSKITDRHDMISINYKHCDVFQTSKKIVGNSDAILPI